MRFQNDEPLWLPAGSVRAILHLMAVSVALYTLVVDGTNEWAYGMLVGVLGLYTLSKAGTAVTEAARDRMGIGNANRFSVYETADIGSGPGPESEPVSGGTDTEYIERQKRLEAMYEESKRLDLRKQRLEVLLLEKQAGPSAAVARFDPANETLVTG